MFRVNAAVLGYSSPSLFVIDGVALHAVTIGSTASAIGIFVDAVFLFSYSGADPIKFEVRTPASWQSILLLSYILRDVRRIWRAPIFTFVSLANFPFSVSSLRFVLC